MLAHGVGRRLRLLVSRRGPPDCGMARQKFSPDEQEDGEDAKAPGGGCGDGSKLDAVGDAVVVGVDGVVMAGALIDAVGHGVEIGVDFGNAAAALSVS